MKKYIFMPVVLGLMACTSEYMDRPEVSQALPQKVTVTYQDVQSGRLLKTSLLSSEQLPDVFKGVTVIHLADEHDWQVVEALPRQKSDFQNTGRLSLKLMQLPTQYTTNQLKVPAAMQEDPF